MNNEMMQEMVEAVEEIKEAIAEAVKNPNATLGYKVLIAEVWKNLPNPVSLEGFKLALVELNRHGMISLSRADMFYALPDRELAEASEINHMNSQFHFIYTD